MKDAAGDKAGAAADRAEGMKRVPADPASFVIRGLARRANDPEGALADFRAAEKLDPFYPGCDGQSGLAARREDEPPGGCPGGRGSAAGSVPRPPHRPRRPGGLLARLGRARRSQSPQPAATWWKHRTPSTYYQAACVFAIVSKTDPKYRDEAVRLVATALLRGFGHDFLLTDEDLDPIRDNEQFRKLADGVKVMKDLGGKK